MAIEKSEAKDQSTSVNSGHASDVEKAHAEPALEDQLVAGYRPSRTTWSLMMFAMLLGGMLFGLDTTIAADVQGSIFQTFGDIEKLPWVGIGFPMASVAIILLTGKLFGTFDIKWLLVTFFVLFEVGSALCGAAPNINALIVGRVLAGLGGAGMYIGALNYIGIFTTLKERPIYHALVGLCWGIGAILGPVIGGAFAVNPHATWRWAFYINLPLAATQTPIFLFVVPRYNPQPDKSNLAKLKAIDWVGALLQAALFVLFIITLTLSGSVWPWRSAASITLWVLSGVLTILFGIQQYFALLTTPDTRLFPIAFLKSRTMLLLFLVTAASGATAGITIYWIPLLFQFTRGDSAIQAAVRLLPYIIPYVVAMMLSGGLLPVVRAYAPIYLLSGALVLAGGAAMFRVTSGSARSAIYGFEALLGIGAGASYQIAYAVAGIKVGVGARELPDAIGFVNIAQIGGITIGLAIAGCMFQNLGFESLRAALAEFHPPDALLRAALGGAQSDLSRVPAFIRQRIVDAVVQTVTDLFGLVIAAGALMVVGSALLRWERLSFDVPSAGGA